jgi:2-(1,2-epoxy-1,2-dihydrophenyl)acetyl-CoA isomerase
MPNTKVTIERAGDVAIIRLNEPETLNAITPAMIEELDRAIDSCANSARTIVLSSVGRAFCSGANLSADGLSADKNTPFDAGMMLATHVNPLIAKLRDLPVPWIAAVRGAVAGVGCSIALSADMIIASDTAYFLQAFSRIGLVPDGGATWILTRTLGRARAMELMLLGDRLSAEAALQWGLINRVVPDGSLDESALALAVRLAQGPTRAFALTRALSWKAAEQELDAVLAAERDAQRDAGQTSDAAEGIAAFGLRRAPIFTGC